MSQTDKRIASNVELGAAAAQGAWAPLPASVTGGAFPAAPITDEGRIRLGGQAPMFLPTGIADGGQMALGGQAPMFLPAAIADAGLVRLGGQSPAF